MQYTEVIQDYIECYFTWIYGIKDSIYKHHNACMFYELDIIM